MSEFENPTTHSLVGDFEAALGQQILDVSEAQREAAIEPYGVLGDLGAGSGGNDMRSVSSLEARLLPFDAKAD